ncbi:long-chain fatty acid--CoA ligase [Pseudaminobacter arsenicus]|uniref:Long-chain fatty acid--CoA ligase n=1 Tax=Borborobacter arsenicus TaxID=1851146 RepID=A0A432V5J3_9HYPH|nr:AMP-binding protein [Pseudaminobacter arsenicus]RUM97432.1 long-chain fatty acid--CoA ligase [Pseudaminobacter arsenicus]
MSTAATAPAAEITLDTFPKYLLHNAARFGNRAAMRHKDYGIWQSWNWNQQLAEIRSLALGLQALGLKRGDRIAVIGANRPRLYWTFTAAQSLGATPVPVYADAVAEEMAYVLDHAGVRFAVVQDQEQVDKIRSFAEKIPLLTDIIYDEPRGLADYDPRGLHAIADLQRKGEALLKADTGLAARWEEEIRRAGGDDISVMLYTSGTTGRSKGVMIRADAAVKAALDTAVFDKLSEDDSVLAYLPLAWVGDHYLNYAQGYVAAFCMCCPESNETVAQDLREIGPTFYFAPPRIFEGLLTSVTIRMEDAGWVKRKLFDHYIKVARKYGEAILEGRPVPLSGRLSYALGKVLLYGPLRNVLGMSNIRVAYTAGEAIGQDLFSFFRSLGINLKQLYGQTEAFLYVTAQKDGEVRADTVGPAAPNVDIRISDTGEVQFRSPGMFTGYFKQEGATEETLTEDGYVKTGDAGFFDTDGQLKIIDRAKDVGKLRSGALFAPKYIENTLKFFPNIKEAVAYGDGRDFAAAFINIDLQAVGNWAERNNIAYASYQELAGHRQVYDMIARNVDETNLRLSKEPIMAGAQIKRFLILHKELDADDGELTRTLKVRRAFVADRYAPLIEALYDGSTEKYVETEMTYEDGRKGTVRATVRIMDAKVHPAAQLVREAAE